MSEQSYHIHSLTASILKYMQENRNKSTGVNLALQRLDEMDLSINEVSNTLPVESRHENILDLSIKEIDNPSLKDIASKLSAAKQYLVWREDNNNYYKQGTEVGQGYRKCNLHTQLIGPDASGYFQSDFILGFFLLGPWTLYRDHRHAAPELYLNLSNRTGWRIKSRHWQDYSAGSFVWNEAHATHATRVYSKPFLSIFIWLENIEQPCFLVPCSDWKSIEAKLEKKSY